MKKYFFSCFIVGCMPYVYSFAQREKIDSLKSLLNENDDVIRSSVLLEIAVVYMDINRDSSRKYLNVVLQSKNKAAVAKANHYLGDIQLQNGNLTGSLKNYLAALSYYEETSDKINMANVYSRTGELWRFQHEFEKALSHHQFAFSIYEELGDSIGLSAALNDIALVYEAKQELETALSYHEKALRIKKNLKDKGLLGDTYCNMGTIYRAMGKYEKALEYQYMTLKIDEELGDEVNTAIIHNNIAALLILTGNTSDALLHLTKAEQLAKLHSARDPLKYTYLQYSLLFEKRNDFRQAYQFHIRYSSLKDTLLNAESTRQIAEMQTKYETEKKEQQITLLNKDKELQDAQLNRQKTVIWFVICGLLLVSALSVFIFRERRKSEKLLLNILPVETARELKRNGKTKAKHYESVTVMFTDFKGFTSIAEKLSAEELVAELDFLFKKFDEIISKYNIEKIKTIGDAYMCASGLPTPNSNHAENIIRAAIEIQDWIQNGYRLSVNGDRSNTGHQSPGTNYWHLRIGIHTGPVTAGVVGDKKFAYDIWGDTVNTASRMESSGEPGKVNISGSTYPIIKDKFTCSFRGKIPAKNKGEIEMYFVEMPSNRWSPAGGCF